MSIRNFDFKTLINKKVSMLLVGLNSKKEAYVGTVTDVYEDFVELKCPSLTDEFPITGILIRKDQVLSIWIYK